MRKAKQTIFGILTTAAIALLVSACGRDEAPELSGTQEVVGEGEAVGEPDDVAGVAGCQLSADQSTITAGDSIDVMFHVEGEGVVSATFNGSPASLEGEAFVVEPAETTSYAGSVVTELGVTTCSLTIEVIPLVTPKCSLTSSTLAVEPGGTATLTLSVTGDHELVYLDGEEVTLTSGELTTEVAPTLSKTYNVTVTGRAGTTSCDASIAVAQTSAPRCTLSVDRDTVVLGETAEITLNAEGDVGSVVFEGSTVQLADRRYVQSVTPSTSQSYTASVTGPGGTNTCAIAIAVEMPAAPTCVLTTQTSQIEKGDSVEVRLQAHGIFTSAEFEGAQVSLTPAGSYVATDSPTATKTYSARVEGPGGSGTCALAIDVMEPEAPRCTLVAINPEIERGQSATLTLTASGSYNTVRFEGSTVNVDSNGVYTTSVSPTVTKTYTATVSDSSGSNTCSTVVTVRQPPPPTCTLQMSPATVMIGESAVATLIVSGQTTEATFDGVGITLVDGGYQTTLTPNTTTSHTATVTGPGGSTQCTAVINVTIPPPPQCQLSASPAIINQTGQQSTITMIASGTYDSASFDGSQIALSGGSYQTNVAPQATKSYQGIVTGPGGSTACVVTVTVDIPQPPVCTLTGDPTNLEVGQSTTLTLAVSGSYTTVRYRGQTVTLDAQNRYTVTETVTEAGTQIYQAQVQGPGGDNSCSANILAVEPQVPVCNLFANPNSVYTGNQTQLTLSFTGIVSDVVLDGDVVTLDSNNRYVVMKTMSAGITSTQRIEAMADWSGGTVSCHVDVEVVVPNAPTCVLSSNRGRMNAGETIDITLSTSGVVDVAEYMGTVVPPGLYTSTESPTVTTVYRANVTGPGGSGTCAKTITVNPPPSGSFGANYSACKDREASIVRDGTCPAGEAVVMYDDNSSKIACCRVSGSFIFSTEPSKLNVPRTGNCEQDELVTGIEEHDDDYTIFCSSVNTGSLTVTESGNSQIIDNDDNRGVFSDLLDTLDSYDSCHCDNNQFLLGGVFGTNNSCTGSCGVVEWR